MTIKNGTWKGYKLFDLYKEAATPYEWHEKLFDHVEYWNYFSTPF